MANPIVCQCELDAGVCGVKNSLLAEECRRCGAILTQNGLAEKRRELGGHIPIASWETDSVSHLWRTEAATSGKHVVLDAHEFLKYALLLNSMQCRFDLENEARWFDDCIFFLRGGYDFFCHLNLSTPQIAGRARIFGGLGHARRPSKRFGAWLTKLIEEAVSHGFWELDIFVGEEVNGGFGTRRLLKLVQTTLKMSNLRLPQKMTIRFRYFLAAPDSSRIRDAVAAKPFDRGGEFGAGMIRLENSFVLFQGPLLAYDAEIFSGIEVLSQSTDEIEKYKAVKYSSGAFQVRCPTTSQLTVIGTGDADLANLTGTAVLELLGKIDSPFYRIFGEHINRSGCDTCKALYEKLRNPSDCTYAPTELT